MQCPHSKALEEWVFISTVGVYINELRQTEYTKVTDFNKILAEKTGLVDTLTYAFTKGLIRHVEYQEFKPMIDDHFYQEAGSTFYNRYRAPTVFKSKSNRKTHSKLGIHAQRFFDHIKYLTDNKEERDTLLDFFAHTMQNPGVKLSWAVLIVSSHQGIGKSILELLFSNILGNYCGQIDNHQLDSQWTDFLKDKLMLFCHEVSQGDKYQVMNRLKNIITEPRLIISQRHVNSYTITNAAALIMFSNLLAPVNIKGDDRRFFVVHSYKEPQSEEYYKKIVDSFTNHYTEIFHYLKSRDLSNFNPKAAPMITESKKIMIEQNKTELEIFLDERKAQNEAPFKDKFISISNFIDSDYGAKDKKRITYKSVRAYLLADGYIEKVRKYKGPEKPRIDYRSARILAKPKVWDDKSLNISEEIFNIFHGDDGAGGF